MWPPSRSSALYELLPAMAKPVASSSPSGESGWPRPSRWPISCVVAACTAVQRMHGAAVRHSGGHCALSALWIYAVRGWLCLRHLEVIAVPADGEDGVVEGPRQHEEREAQRGADDRLARERGHEGLRAPVRALGHLPRDLVGLEGAVTVEVDHRLRARASSAAAWSAPCTRGAAHARFVGCACLCAPHTCARIASCCLSASAMRAATKTNAVNQREKSSVTPVTCAAHAQSVATSALRRVRRTRRGLWAPRCALGAVHGVRVALCRWSRRRPRATSSS